MVYGRRYYKNRRAYRRGTRTLSTRSIFNNKGSRAQASQIFALKRRINSVYRQCKPELKIVETNPQQFIVSSYSYNADQPQNLTVDFTQPQNAGRIMSINMPSPGYGDKNFTGNIFSYKDMTVYINLHYDQLVDMRLNDYGRDVHDQAHVRFVFFMNRNANDDLPEANDLFKLTHPNNTAGGDLTTGSYPPGYRMNTVLPLLEGTSARFKILRDIRVKVGNLNPDKQLRVKIPLSRYSKFIQTQQQAFGESQLFCCMCTSGLEVKGIRGTDLNYVYIVPTITCDWFSKIAYTDP